MNLKIGFIIVVVALFAFASSHKDDAFRLNKNKRSSSYSSASSASNADSNHQTSRKIEKQHTVTFFEIQDYKAPKDGSQPYSVGCSNSTSGLVQVTDIGRSWGSVCASGGNMGSAICKPKGTWSLNSAAKKVCSG